MDLQKRYDELLRAAGSIGLVIRHVPLGGEGGGFCVVKGERRLFVDTIADLETRYDKTLQALASLPEMDALFLTPEVREDLECHRRNELSKQKD